jgi:hypothetical protein
MRLWRKALLGVLHLCRYPVAPFGFCGTGDIGDLVSANFSNRGVLVPCFGGTCLIARRRVVGRVQNLQMMAGGRILCELVTVRVRARGMGVRIRGFGVRNVCELVLKVFRTLGFGYSIYKSHVREVLPKGGGSFGEWNWCALVVEMFEVWQMFVD